MIMKMISALFIFFTWNDLHMKAHISTCREDRTTCKSQIHKEAVQMGDNSCNFLLSSKNKIMGGSQVYIW